MDCVGSREKNSARRKRLRRRKKKKKFAERGEALARFSGCCNEATLYSYLRASTALILFIALTLISSQVLAASFQAESRKYKAYRELSTIPGLYNVSELPLKTIQGLDEFGSIVWLDNNRLPNEQTINLVQFYMATCPDCQGYSPYFKRFVSDVGYHWHKLVSIEVVNCNDDNNIGICWRENPKLLVPQIKWYSWPTIVQHMNQSGLILSVSHREYIDKQLRDIISIRHATLRFITSILGQLATQALKRDSTNSSVSKFYHNLPTRWRLLQHPIERQLERATTNGTRGEEGNGPKMKLNSIFLENLSRRVEECKNELSATNETQVENLIVFESPNSFAGKTLVADWSNWTCSSELPIRAETLLLVHYSNDFRLLNEIELSNSVSKERINGSSLEERSPLLFSFKLNTNETLESLDQLELNLVSLNEFNRTITTTTTAAATQPRLSKRQSGFEGQADFREYPASHLGRLSQRLSLEQFYNRRRSLDSGRHQFKYAASMNLASKEQSPRQRKRSRRQVATVASPKKKAERTGGAEFETVNWKPEEFWPNIERLRYQFNIEAAKIVFGNDWKSLKQFSIAGYPDGHQGKIELPTNQGTVTIVDPKEDDLTRVRLTDYYKVLDEMVHKNILAKNELEGHQFMSIVCLLRQLVKNFPFQGEQSARSISRHYLDLMQRNFVTELRDRLEGKFEGCFKGRLKNETHNRLKGLKIESKQLEILQADVRRKHDVGMPNEGHFKWSYCSGSESQLRGYTCSLWILFHTLTVHEYIQATNQTSLRSNIIGNADEDPEEQLEEYKFKINYSNDTSKCDPENPEDALINASSQNLFVESTQFVLANIINFIRYFLPCTNCASHFNCMVLNSNIDFSNPEPDNHLLWLWEAHNRVNMRTKGTHSEDPTHPKHIYPDYEACPSCYLEKPVSNKTNYTAMRFNRREVAKFLVARYRRSAILNNKIRIEELYKKPPPSAKRQ